MWRVKRDMAVKVGKCQAGVECPAEELASYLYTVTGYRRVSFRAVLKQSLSSSVWAGQGFTIWSRPEVI